MTAEEFRQSALSLSGAEEGAHMGHADFRVGGKIFATVGYPDKNCGMVKLTPEQQRGFMEAHPSVFKPASGAWGVQGSTLVRLEHADAAVVQEAMRLAFDTTVAKTKAKSRKRSA